MLASLLSSILILYAYVPVDYFLRFLLPYIFVVLHS